MPQAIPIIIAAAQSAIGASAAGLLGTALKLTAVEALLASVAVSAIGAVAMQALAPDAPKAQLQTGQIVVRESLAPRLYAFGRVRLGGTPVYTNTGEKDGDYPKRLIATTVQAAHQLAELEEIWLADAQVEPDEDGVVTGDTWQSKVQVELHDGDKDQTASPLMLAALPDEWSADHRLRGLAYMVTTYKPGSAEDHYQIFQGGPPPGSAVWKAAKVYDPRNPAQDPDDPETWAWSDNASLVILWQLIGKVPTSTGYMPVGWGFDPAVIDMDAFAAAADCCDDDIPLKAGGAEKRWRLWGTWKSRREAKAETMAKMLECCGGRIDLSPQGKITLTVGGQDVGTLPVITDTDRGGIRELELTPGITAIDRINEVQALWYSEEANWSLVPAAPIRDQAAKDRDGPEVKELELKFCPSETQAQRLALAELRKARPLHVGRVVTGLQGYDALGSEYVRIVTADLGGIDAVAEIIEPRPILDTATDPSIEMTIRITEPLWAWDPETDEQDPDPVPEAEPRDPIDPPVIEVTVQSQAIDSVTSVAVLKATWADPDEDDQTMRIRWRPVGTTAWLTAETQDPDELSLTTPPVADGTTYEVQALWLSGAGPASDWSTPAITILATADQTAPAAPALSGMGAVGGTITGYADVPDDDHAYRLLVQHDTDPTFGSPTTGLSRVIIPGDRIIMSIGPLADATYYVRARLGNRSGVASAWSDSETVTIDTVGGP